MTAKDFRQEQDYPYNHFTKLTSTGIAPNYDHIEEYAEAYYQAKVKNLGIHGVVFSEAELCQCDAPQDEEVDGFLICQNCNKPV